MSGGGSYDPSTIETQMYAFWEEGGHFRAVADPDRRPYTIVIPPPNVTGALHLGHALNNTLQDILIRRARMQGFNACWLPGTDHAGIATQAVVEKRLREEQGKTRQEIGREALVERIWAWKEEYNARILEQLRRMGCSCDWERTRFTLDEGCVRAVYEIFFRWFRDGLIYRGQRLVNWDTQLQTAVADDEVYHETVRGHLWHVRYPIVPAIPGGTGVAPVAGSAGVPPANSGEHRRPARPNPVDAIPEFSTGETPMLPENAQPGVDYLVVATTRPETMLADTAIAVHPDDERYRHLIGRRVVLPLTGRTIPIIADGILVQREFGTGCVKVTPGHDPNDYACWQRKQGQPDEIDIRNMMTPDGRVDRPHSGIDHKYAGLKLEEARKRVVADLEAAGLLEKTEPYETDVGHSDRSKTPIQPYLSEQWFLKMGHDALAEPALEAVRDGRVRFFPERFAKSYLDWLGEKRDWCISRQLWWGHRIPVWTARLRVEWNEPPEKVRANGIAAQAAVKKALGKLTESIGLGQCLTLRDTGHDSGCYVHICARTPEAIETFRKVAKQLRGPAKHVAVAAKDDPLMPLTGGLGAAYEASCLWEQISQDIREDDDVLDTWFSSQLWPFSTFGWPNAAGPQPPSAASHGAQSPGTGETPVPPRLGPQPPSAACGTGFQSEHGGQDARPTQDARPSPRDLDYFYPTAVLSTARDIISLWVARMVLAGLYCTGRVPFQHVLIHPTIQDAQGRRMAKSLGNGVDPLDLIEMYGADAMRYTLASLAGETQDVRIPVKPTTLPDGRTVNTSERFELGRNFCNKLWQAVTGFVLPNIESVAIGADGGAAGAESGAVTESQAAGADSGAAGAMSRAAGAETRAAGADSGESGDYPTPLPPREGPGEGRISGRNPLSQPLPGGERSFGAPSNEALALEDRWILSRLRACIEQCDRRLARYEFSDYAAALYSFFWSDFCDWYVEWIKPRLAQRNDAGEFTPRFDPPAQTARRVLAFVTDQVLRLMHPAVPFITEALWQKLNVAAPQRGLCGLRAAEPALIRAAWPRADGLPADAAAEREMDALQTIIRAVREVRARVNVLRAQAKQPAIRTLPRAAVRAPAELSMALRGDLPALVRLGQCDAFEIGPDVAKPDESFATVLAGVEVYVPVGGLADLAIERQRLAKQLEELRGQKQRVEGKLANEGFVRNAAAAVVEKERARAAELDEQIQAVRRNLAELGG